MRNIEITERNLSLHGLSYPMLEAGEGPLVVLLHGFPDNNKSFRPQLEVLAANGYRAIAPMLPGYSPSNLRPQGSHNPIYVRDCLNDIVEVLLQENDEKRCHLIAHDWGAVVSYLMIEHRPDLYKSYVSLGIPGGMSWLKMATRCPTYLINSFYILLFQIPVFAEWLFKRQNSRFMRWLTGLWSPRLKDDIAFLDDRANTMAQPGVLKAALSYYRNSFYGLNAASFKTRALLKKPIHIPVLAIRGEDDFGVPASTWECISPSQFKGGLTLESLTGAGHFFHVEEPKYISQRLIRWLDNHQE